MEPAGLFGVGIVGLLPLVIMMIPAAIGAGWVAPKMGARRWLWVVLLLIPLVNIVAIYVFFFRSLGAILDKLNTLLESRAQQEAFE